MTVLKELQQLELHTANLIIGQSKLINRMLIALLCDGHLLVEGAPGLAKTRAIKVLSDSIEGSFNRLQFTPDLLPADLTGTEIYRPQKGTFEFREGPLFHNLILADEINRAPAKVQSALLEAMEERQISVGDKSYELSDLFLVMATQNPIEQEGTYPLPEAQVDRFMFKLKVHYPSLDEELQVIQRMGRPDCDQPATKVFKLETLAALRAKLGAVYIDEKIERYLLRIVRATRDPDQHGLQIAPYIRYGASPRASIFLALAAKGHALMAGVDYVRPHDVKAVTHDVLRHRIALSYRAEAESIISDSLIDQILNQVPIHLPQEAR